MISMKLYLGTSGWSYDEWVGIFYEKSENKLQQYIRVFNTVEMDSTFYSYPSLSTTSALARILPKNFKICAKMPNIITHKKLLGKQGNIVSDLERFLAVMQPIIRKGTLGAILIQLSPGLRYDYNLLGSFLDTLSSFSNNIRYAIEFRDKSWLRKDIYLLLERYGVAYTIVDEPLLPPDIVITADFSYIRWHGHGAKPWYNYWYKDEELKTWVPKIREILNKVEVLYGYFNNHYRAYAVHNCLKMLLLLGLINERQKKVLETVESNILKPKVSIKKLNIDVKELDQKSVLELLFILSTKERVQRGVKISPHEVVIRIRDNIIEAKIREYKVLIDISKRVIFHNCADWAKIAVNKQLCKHLVRIFTQIPEEKAKVILRDVITNIDKWQFKTI